MLLNFHPESHLVKVPKKDPDYADKIMEAELNCLDIIGDSLNVAIDVTKGMNVKLVIENTAGQGTNLGYKDV